MVKVIVAGSVQSEQTKIPPLLLLLSRLLPPSLEALELPADVWPLALLALHVPVQQQQELSVTTVQERELPLINSPALRSHR